MKNFLARLYPFEVFALVNVVVVHLLLLAHRVYIGPYSIVDSALTSAPTMVLPFVAGLIVRFLLARKRGETPRFLSTLRDRTWLTDSIRVVVASTLTLHVYTFLKLFIPLINPKIWDRELIAIEQTLFGGMNLNALGLNLFAAPLFVKFIDWTYAWVFVGTTLTAWAFFLSTPNREMRLRFVWGSTILWIAGVWLYLAFPTLGPIYTVEEIWRESTVSLPRSNFLQTLLMKNYAMVLRVPSGYVDPNIRQMMGIAAFPSLHVGLHTFVFLWMKDINRAARFVFGMFVLLIALGSVITGWHYATDAVGGALLAWAAYRIALRFPKRPMAGGDPAVTPAPATNMLYMKEQ